MKLNEYKNISNEVYEFSTYLYKKIIEECQRLPKQMSRINVSVYNEGNFVVKENATPNWIFKGIDELNVSYIMYYTDDVRNYNFVMHSIGGKANSQSDYETKSMRIVSGFIDGDASPDFLATICHEVNHLFEYDNGREKRIGLYERVVSLMQSEDDVAQAVGQAIYHTFPHEIDAFVHQFYGFLKQEDPSHLTFEQLLQHSAYYNLERLYDYIIAKNGNTSIGRYINYLGYRKRDFIRRLKFGMKRLLSKLKNAYLRYLHDFTPINEGRIHWLIERDYHRHLCCEQYNEEIKWGIESIYNFN